MAIITIQKKEIEKIAKVNDNLIEKIALLGTPVESVKENEIEVEVLPNRPDMFSTHGFLRAFSSFMGKETGLKKYKVNPPEKNFKVKIDKSVAEIRPFTACAIVKSLSLDDERIKEIINLQEKLHNTLGRNRRKLAIGIYPLDKITLPIKYEARKPKNIKFVPLDYSNEMTAQEILQKHPAGKEYAPLLQNLEKYPVFVDNKNKILSMPPIINSNETGKVTKETKEVFIECSGFDFNSLKKALNIIVTNMADMGGKIYAIELGYGKKEITPNLTPEKIKINLERVNKLIGLNLREKEIEKLLAKMGHGYKNNAVFVPAWRTDILHEVDIIEDITIAYGYDKLEPEMPNVATTGEELKEEKANSKLAEILIGLGLIEISTYHLIKEDEAKTIGLEKKEIIEVENSKTEYNVLRPNLLIPALRILSENKDNEYPQNIFEIGTVFKKDKNEETGINERTHLIVALSPANFTKTKQILDYLIKMLSIECRLEESVVAGLIDGRTAKIMLDENEIGYLGEVHPETLREWNIKMPLAVLEINLDKAIL